MQTGITRTPGEELNLSIATHEIDESDEQPTCADDSGDQNPSNGLLAHVELLMRTPLSATEDARRCRSLCFSSID